MKNALLQLLTRIGVPALLRKAKGRDITVLCFHRVSRERDFFFDPVDPESFEKIVQYCSKNYHITSFARVNEPASKPKLILSFDDGYYDFMENVVPVLVKYNIPCNHNLVNSCLSHNTTIWTQQLNDIFNHLRTNHITDNKTIAETSGPFTNDWFAYYNAFFQKLLTLKKEERDDILGSLLAAYKLKPAYRMMNWEDASLCAGKYQVEIGCHTYTHDCLATLDTREELDAEIGRSLEELEARLGNKISLFAPPNGRYNQATLDYLKEKGIEHILILDDKTAVPASLQTKGTLVSRINMGNEPLPLMILRAEQFHAKLKKLL